MIKTRPALFKDDLVRTLLSGNKTQTRRPLKDELIEAIRCHAGWDHDDEAPVSFAYDNAQDDEGDIHAKQWLVYSSEYPEEGVEGLGQCPLGKAGDLIYVREAFTKAYVNCWNAPKATNPNDKEEAAFYRADWDRSHPTWKPSIHMPRWASRLTLKITNVRIERIQDISKEDAKTEGFDYSKHPSAVEQGYAIGARTNFIKAWQDIYPGSWSKNEWVWVIDFEVIHKNVDQVLSEMEKAV